MPEKKRIHFFILFFSVVFLAGCTTNMTRFQTTETLGAGNMKMQAAVTLGFNNFYQIDKELEKEMDEKSIEDARGTYDSDYVDIVKDGASYDSYKDYSYFQSSLEIIYALGVTNDIDIDIRASTGGQFRLNGKFKLPKFGRGGALAIAPGIGFQIINIESETDDGETTITTDTISGYLYTATVPLIIGWKCDVVCLYMHVGYGINLFDITYERDVSGIYQYDFKKFEDVHIGYVALGMEAKFKHFMIGPEILAGMSNYYVLSQLGIALGAHW